MLKELLESQNIEDLDTPFSRYKLKALKECIPINATIELTLNCNFKCHHCYNYDRSASIPESYKNQGMSDSEVFHLIDQLREAGTMYLSFSGGEPLLHPSIYKFVSHTRSRNMAVKLKSNGSLITKEKAKELIGLGVKDIDISLYGSNEKTHELFTRSHGTFGETLQGIKNAVDVGISTSVNFIVHDKNYLELGKVKELIGTTGAHLDTGIDMTVRHDNSESSLGHRISPEQFEEMIQREEGSHFRGTGNASRNVQCPCARTNCGISFKGDVFPCIGAPIYAGNIRKQKFIDIWKKSKVLNDIRNYEEKDYKDCQDCNLREFCPRSGGSAYLNIGEFTGAETWECEIAEILKRYSTKV